MTIRNATKSDIPQLIALGKKFFDASKYSDFTTYSEEVVGSMLENMIDDKNSILIVLEVGKLQGMLGAIIYPMYMSGELTGQEMFWWCEKRGEGGKLLTAAEDKARELGAKSFTMLSLDQLTPDRLDRIYSSRGYVSSEHSYIRSL